MPSIVPSVYKTIYKADVTDHQRKVRQLTGEQRKQAKATLDAVKDQNAGLEQQIQTWSKVAAGIGLAVGAVKFLSDGFKIYQEDVKLAAATTGVNLKELQDATGGLVEANKLLAFSAKTTTGTFALSNEENAKALRGIRALAKNTGTDLPVAMEAAKKAIIEGTTEPLKELGKNIRTTNDSLTGQAAVLNILEGEWNKLGGAVSLSTDKVGQAQTTFADSIRQIKSNLGQVAEGLLPVVKYIAQAARGLAVIQNLAGGDNSSKNAKSELGRFRKQRNDLQAEINKLNEDGGFLARRRARRLGEELRGVNDLLVKLEKDAQEEITKQAIARGRAAALKRTALRKEELKVERDEADKLAREREAAARKASAARKKRLAEEAKALAELNKAAADAIAADEKFLKDSLSSVGVTLQQLQDEDYLAVLAENGIDKFEELEQTISSIKTSLQGFGDGSTGLSDVALNATVELRKLEKERDEILAGLPGSAQSIEAATAAREAQVALSLKTLDDARIRTEFSLEQIKKLKEEVEAQQLNENFSAVTGQNFVAPAEEFQAQKAANTALAASFDLVQASALASYDAIISGEESVSGALQKVLAAELKTLGVRAVKKGLFYGAEAIAFLGAGNPVSAGKFAAASAGMFALAAGLGAASAAVAPASSAPSAPATSNLDSGAPLGEGSGGTTVFLLGESFTDKPATQRVAEFRRSGRRAGLSFEGDVVERT